MKVMINSRSAKVIGICVLFYFITPVNADIPWLHVEGNRIKDPQGNVVVLRGLVFNNFRGSAVSLESAFDMIDKITDKNDSQGNSPGWYTKVIRTGFELPYKEIGDKNGTFNPDDDSLYNDRLRPFVDYCAQKDLYVIILIGSTEKNTWNTFSQISEFWRYMAPRFSNDSHILFELYNEPVNEIGSDTENWLSVRTDTQAWVDIVRSYAPHNLILVGGWGYSEGIEPAATYPVSGNNIVYVSHVYPGPWLSNGKYNRQWYENQIRACAAVHPVIMTEWGFGEDGEDKGTISNYGQPLMDLREELKISNTAMCIRAGQENSIFYDDGTLRCGEDQMGCFVKDKLYEKRNDDQPHGEVQPPADLPYLDTEDFETNDLRKLPWKNSGDESWSTTQQESNSGNYSARAGSIGSNQTTSLEVTMNCASGYITFYRKVSSESDFDHLKFYIDGQEQDEWSGERDWAEASFPVDAGIRTFEWTYSKDSSVSNGDDTAWIDDITFPVADKAEPPEIPFTRGVNLTNWLQASNVQQIQFTKFTKQDLINIKHLGGDVIRLPINLHAMTSSSPDYTIDPLFYSYLDQIVDWAEDLEIHLILDNHSFDTGVDTSPDIGNILIPVWTQVAQHYKNRTRYVYYEVLNEPHGISDTMWNQIQQQVIDAIRAVDQTHTIIVGPAGWNSYNNLKFMPEYEDDNLIYTFHFYDPFLFTHQGASWTDPSLESLAGVPFPYYAGDIPVCPPELENTWVKDNLTNYRDTETVEHIKELIDIAADFQNTRNVPLFCGEFGVYIPNSGDKNRLYWYSLVRSCFELKGIAWTMWDYKGGFGLFKYGTEELIDYDLNIPLVQALGFTGRHQKIRPDVNGFDLYLDDIGPNIREASPFRLVDYYSQDNPASGDYCMHWKGGLGQYNATSFIFVPDKNLSKLADEGFAFDFWVRCDNPDAKFDIRFVDTKTDDPDDHPWRMIYTINRNIAKWNGEWNHVQIPLNAFYEEGSLDIGWFDPVGAFDWSAIGQLEFEITTKNLDLAGIDFYLDDILVAKPDPTVVLEPTEGFAIYLDDMGQNITGWGPDEGLLDFYSQDDPASGDFCMLWTGVGQGYNMSFSFILAKDLSVLVNEGYVLDFWIRCDSPNMRISIWFMDTKTNDPDDHPWRMMYLIDRNVANWDGRWNHLQIPLNAFYEQGSWDGSWFDPVGAFDWTAVKSFHIVTEHNDLIGINLYFDDIRIICPKSPIRVDLSANGDVEPGWIDWNSEGTQNNIDIERRFLNEIYFDDDFTIKFIKVDARNRAQMSSLVPLHDLLEDDFKESNAFDMQIKNLTAGKYIITTYHHDPLEDVENDDGTINITVRDADGTRVVADHLQQSWGQEPTTVASVTFTFVSNGIDDVVINFEDNNDGIHNEAHLNGFQLDFSE